MPPLMVLGVVLDGASLLGCVFCIFWYHRFRGGHLFAVAFLPLLFAVCLGKGEGASSNGLAIGVLAVALLVYLGVVLYAAQSLYVGSPPMVTEFRERSEHWVKYGVVPLYGRPAKRYWLAVMILPTLQVLGGVSMWAEGQLEKRRQETANAERRAALRKQLQDGDPDARFNAALELALAKQSPEEEAQVLSALADGFERVKPEHKRNAVMRMEFLKGQRTRAVQFLRSALKDRDPEVRREAVRTLVNGIPKEDAQVGYEDVIAMARVDPDDKVRHEAVLAVIRIDLPLYEKEFKR